MAKPTCVEGMNPTIFAKTSKVVEQILAKRALNKGVPQRFKPHTCGVSQWNRKGQSPNMMYIHGPLFDNMKKDGFDPKRAKPGLAIVYNDSGPKLDAALAYNKRIAEFAPGLWPPVDAEHMRRFTLSFSHMTIKLRLHEAESVCEITGKSFKVNKDDDEDLHYVAKEGHEYIALSEDTTEEEALLLSDWYNSDQDQNTGTSEASILKTIQLVVQGMVRESKLLKVSSVVQRVAEQSIVKINPLAIGHYAKFVIELGAEDLIDEWLIFFSTSVNPIDLACPPALFNSITTEIGRYAPLFKVNVAQIMYDPSVVQINQRPIPDSVKFVTAKEIENVAKDKGKISTIEAFLKANRALTQNIICKHTSKTFFLTVIRMFEHNVVRLAFGKPLLPDYKVSKSVFGKFTAEKMNILQYDWVMHLQSMRTALSNLAVELDLKVVANDESTGGDDAVVEVVAVKDNEVVAEPAAKGGFKIGHKVELTKRITATFAPQTSGDEEYRKDIQVGDAFFVVDTKMVKKDLWPVLEIITTDEYGYERIAKVHINPTHIKLHAETGHTDDPAKKGSDVDAPASSKAKWKPIKGLEFLGNIDPDSDEKISLVTKWKTRQAHKEEDNRISRAKDVVEFSLGAILAQLEEYTEDDLIIVSRTVENNTTYDVYAARKFAANTLVLAPDTLEVKDRYYTLGRCSFVRGGNQLHPMRKDIVLDGRLRSKISDLRPFSLFFLVKRATSDDKPNLVVDYAPVEISTNITLPTKRKLSSTYKEADHSGGIALPIMFNPKDIPKHARLLVGSEVELDKLGEMEAKAKQVIAKKAARDAAAKAKKVKTDE